MSAFRTRSSSNLSAISLLLVLSVGRLVLADNFLSITNACTDKEAWTFGTDLLVSKETREMLVKVIEKDEKPIRAFEEGQFIRKTIGATTPANALQAAFADYWMARAFFSAGLWDLAAERFNAVVAQTTAPFQSPVQIAAMKCVQIIHDKYPSVSFSKEALENIPKYFSADIMSLMAKPVIERAAVQRLLYQIKTGAPKPKLQETVDLLKDGGVMKHYALALQAVVNDKAEDVAVNLQAVADAKNLPPYLKTRANEVFVMLGRVLYESGKFAQAAKALERVEKGSNLLVHSLSNLGWAHLMAKNYTHAIGAAVSLQTPGLRKTFAPQSLLVSAIALNELCLYPDALRAITNFKKTYEKTYKWLEDNREEPKKKLPEYYPQAIAFLKGESKLPERIGNEWLRSPVFISYQEGINVLAKSRRLSEELMLEEAGNSDWVAILKAYQAKIEPRQKEYRERIETELRFLNKYMFTEVNFVMVNSELVDAEIANGASKDMLWQHAHPEYVDAVKTGKLTRAPSDFSSKVYDWGAVSGRSEEDDEEVWEDELGSMQARLVNNCSNKEKYIKLLQGK